MSRVKETGVILRERLHMIVPLSLIQIVHEEGKERVTSAGLFKGQSEEGDSIILMRNSKGEGEFFILYKKVVAYKVAGPSYYDTVDELN